MENDVSSAEARSEKKTGDKLWLTLGWRKTTDGADYRLESELVKCSVFFKQPHYLGAKELGPVKAASRHSTAGHSGPIIRANSGHKTGGNGLRNIR